MRWTEADLIAHQRRAGGQLAPTPTPTGRKFSNVRTEVDGKKFDSKLEAGRYQQLLLMQQLGEIRDLRTQVKYPLQVGDELIGVYIADAVYFDTRLDRRVVEDSKGVETPLFKWKAKHFRAQYGFDITLVKRR